MLNDYRKFQRVGVFVDVQNMFYSGRYLKQAKLNFAKLLKKAVNGRQLVRAICYAIENPEIEQYKFTEMLEGNGYEVRSKILRTRADGSAKGDWDMGIAVDVISIANKLDVVVLVTGDGDFADLVYYLKGNGCLVEVISFRQNTNEDLIDAVDHFTPIERDLLIKQKKASK